MSTRNATRLFSAQGPWLFGRGLDLMAFGGSAALSLVLLLLGHVLGIVDGDTPEWLWLLCIVGLDVGHVWSTAFRVYLVPGEVRRRPLLYLGLPALCYLLGLGAYAAAPGLFWRILAYVAVFHFVRQQYGWVALYRRRAGEDGLLDRALDTATIYAATVFPLIHWHAHLPRNFQWFMQGDFVAGLAARAAELLTPLYWGVLALFAARQLQQTLRGRGNPGKALVVATTWACWYLGIVVYNSDYAFTVTNVAIHAIPYLVLTYRYGRMSAMRGPRVARGALLGSSVGVFLSLLGAAALLEEALWARLVFGDHSWLFGPGTPAAPSLLVFLVPLLALPQAVHYALDGFIWRLDGGNPRVVAELQMATPLGPRAIDVNG